ncbi:TetR/AcrR family transcriptional regulator [bacterium]|nr:TetR/AcrR family transcriptional regulator [bacterium]
MAEVEKQNARQRILDVSIALFSKKGYTGVGVREIANEANVNLAMISYYFNGKVGILKEIFEYFFDRYLPIFDDINNAALTPETCFRQLVQKLIQFIRDNTELFLMVYNELPLDVPEVSEIKAKRIGELIQKMSGMMIRFGIDPEDRQLFSIVGPSLISAILTQFRLRPVIQHLFQIEPDESYYQRYTETICSLFLEGVSGIKSIAI